MEKIKSRLSLNRICKFIGFFLLLIVVDLATGSLLEYLFFYPGMKVQDKTSYAIENSNEQILIYGASTAINHFNPAIIQAKTGYTCYNAGMGGQSILYFDALNRCIVKRYNPKIIILNFDWTLYDEQSLSKLGALLPYYRRHPEIRELLRNRSRYESCKLLSHIYPFNSFLYQTGRQLLGSKRKVKDNGFIPEEGTLKINYEKIRNDLARPSTITPEKYAAFKHVIDECKAKNIDLILTITPVYDSTLINTRLFAFAESLAYKYDIPLFNFSTDGRIYGKKEFFIDHGHLNGTGADIFSDLFSDTLSKYIRQKFGLNNKAYSYLSEYSIPRSKK